jgi:phenylalanyl-tRNA synthetase beta chain
MRVPISWLNDYVAPDLSSAELADRLALTGTEVERVEHHGVDALEQFVVGKVLERRRHPDADRLSVCMVDTGGSTPSQIVCGAPNVAAGQIVAVAKPGAIMPDGTKLQKARLRGVESNGMILAEDELALGTDHSETLVLASNDGQELKPGTPLTEVLQIATDVLVLEITPNRPDCLAIYGVAREVHAATATPLNTPPWANDPGSTGDLDGITITVERPDLCPRFTARIFENVTIGPSPLWLKQRLMAAGQRPISNVVDITNYVMLLTGQALHAFDLDRVAGAQLTVRTAKAEEQVQTLDDQTRTLDEDILLIADADGPTSIAGIMGGARSEVGDGTTRVLMEAANWDGANIHRSSLKLALRSEASTRFEKQIQPEQAMQAQAVATQLMIELTGASVRPGTVDIGGDGPALKTISLRDAKLNHLLGTTIPRERSRELLTALEFETKDEPEGLEVTVPAFRRADVNREADLIEEVARLDGVEKLPATLPSRHNASGRLTLRQRVRRSAADALTAQGLHEIVGWSFVAPEQAERLALADVPALTLANPMSSDQSQLRTMLLGSLLDTVRSNRSRGAGALRLFEAGAVYLASEGDQLPHEPHHVAALLYGAVRAPTWRDPEPRGADFFAAKGVLGGALDALMVDWSVRPGTEPFLHPGRCAEVVVDGETVIGWVGEIHPSIAADWELDGNIAGFEIDLDALPEPRTATYVDLTSFPEVREDLAVVIPETVSAAELLAVIRNSGRPLLAHAEVFDVYRDAEKLGEGKVSLAVRLAFRAPDRTLTDAEVASQRESIIAAVGDQLQGMIRGG